MTKWKTNSLVNCGAIYNHCLNSLYLAPKYWNMQSNRNKRKRRLYFIKVIPVLVRRRLYIDTASWFRDKFSDFHLPVTSVISNRSLEIYMYPDSKVHGANMGPTWVLSAPDGPHDGPMNLAIRVVAIRAIFAAVLSAIGNSCVCSSPEMDWADVIFFTEISSNFIRRSNIINMIWDKDQYCQMEEFIRIWK